MPPSSSHPLVVIGAGIGGALLALMLGRLGREVILCDKRHDINELAYGLQLTPNAARCLKHLGLDDQLTPLACRPEQLIIHDALKDKKLKSLALPSPYYTLSRQDLLATIITHVRALPTVIIRTSCGIKHWYKEDGLIKLSTVAGETITAEGVVYAGGVNGKTLGEGVSVPQSVTSAKVAFRAKIDAAINGNQNTKIHLYLGQNCHSLAYPIESGQATNIVMIQKSVAQEVSETPNFKQALPRTTVEALERAKTPWTAWPLLTKQVGAWQRGEGAVTLLGDIAHAMPPFLAQGAAMTIEDAVVLARSIQAIPDLDEAFRAYEDVRRSRVISVGQASANQEKRYHISPWLRPARNVILSFSPDFLLTRATKAIFSFDP